ncbi:MAG: hypothetical protein LBI18_08795 [Planctomycetaceae bacterium]|nr:hypothetical protein [Planctomycetaceae bacterium]
MSSLEKVIKISGLTFNGTLVVVWILRGICLFMFIITIIAIAQKGLHRGYIDNFIICAAIGIPLELWRFSVWQRGQWFQKTDNGFRIRSYFGSAEYRMEDIQSTSLSIREIQPFVLGSEFLERRLTLILPDRKVIMQTFFRFNQPDELASFVELVTEQQWERAEETLNAGNIVSGCNWKLSFEQLLYTNKESEHQIKLNNIDDLRIIKNNLLLWKKENDYPIFQIPLGTENAWILHQYLSAKITKQENHVSNEILKSGLGRFITSYHSPFYTILFLVLTILWSLSIIHAFRNTNEPWGVTVFFSLLYILLVIPLGLNGWNSHLHVWERGFECIHWFDTWTDFYENIHSFSLNKSAQYANGFYIGTWRSLTVTNLKGEKIQFFKNDRSANDGALGLLKDYLTQAVYARLLDHLKNENSVQWTDEIRITKDGIEIKSLGLLVRKQEPVFITYNELQVSQDTNFKGLYLAWGEGTRRTPIKDIIIEPTIATQLGMRTGRIFVPSSIPNFLPGLMLLEHCQILHESPTP